MLNDEVVRKYITDEVMEKCNFSRLLELAKDILEMSLKKWLNREELRFLVKSQNIFPHNTIAYKPNSL